MKAVLISIQPKWCELIANGKKTAEVRKTKPKLDTPFKVYIYCTKSFKYNTPYSYKTWAGYGKVIGEFICNEITVAEYGSYCVLPKSKTMLDELDLLEYANEKTVYGWHISDLVIYDKPIELGEFHKPCTDIKNCLNKAFREAGHRLNKCFDCGCRITRPPQSWCYVEELE